MKNKKVKEPPRVVEHYNGCNILRAYDYSDKLQVGIRVFDTIEQAREYIDKLMKESGKWLE